MYSRNVERELAQVNLKEIMQGRTDYERSALPLSSSETTERTVTNVFSSYTLK
jgi:hypothetical protein